MEVIHWNDPEWQVAYSACQFYETQEERFEGISLFLDWCVQSNSRVVILSNTLASFQEGSFEKLINVQYRNLVEENLVSIVPIPLNENGDGTSEKSTIKPSCQTLASIIKLARYMIVDVLELVSVFGDIDRWPSDLTNLDAFCQRNDLRILYQYDAKIFSQNDCCRFSQMHPLTYQGGILYKNFSFNFGFVNEKIDVDHTRLPIMQPIINNSNHNLIHDDYFRILYEQAPLPYQSLDENGHILDVNSAWCELLQYSKEEVLGTWLGEYLIPAQRDLFKSKFAEINHSKKVSSGQLEMVRKSGETVIVSVEGRISTKPDGSFRQTHCILTDITERIKADNIRSERDQLIQALYENNEDVILLVKPENGMIIDANKAACKYYGYPFEVITQKNISEINQLSEDDVHREMDLARRKKKNIFHFRHQLASGEIREVEVTSRPIILNDENLLYSVIHDITHEKRLEAETNRLKSALHEKLIALTQPLDDVNHLGFTDLFNLPEIQMIQNAFAEAAGVASLITDTEGRAITEPSNFCRLCSEVVRTSPNGLEKCVKSDKAISPFSNSQKTIQPCLSAGLLDVGAPIKIGDHHIANWMIGQVWNPDTSEEQMMEYAGKIGVDPDVYREALKDVHKMPLDKLEKVSNALFLIADQLSKMAIQNIQQARTILERESANTKLLRVNHLYRVISTFSQAAVTAKTPEQLYQLACDVLVEQGKFEVAYIGIFDDSKTTVTINTFTEDKSGVLEREFAPSQFPVTEADPVARSVLKKKIYIKNTIENSPNSTLWEKSAASMGYLSGACLPVISRGDVLGALVIFSSTEDFFDYEETKLLEEISSTLTFSLDAMRAEEERKTAELNLAASEQRYRCLFSSGSDAIFVYPMLPDSIPGNFVEVNEVARERLGYTSEEFLTLSPYQINPPELRDGLNERFKQLDKDRHILAETINITRDGRRIPVEIHSRLIDLNDQKYAFSISRDITERKKAEEKIQTQIQRLSALHIIDTAIASKQRLPVIMKTIIGQIQMQLSASGVIILIYDAKEDDFTHGFGIGLKQPGSEFIVGNDYARRVLSQKSPVQIDDIFGDFGIKHRELMDENAQSFYGIRIDLNTKTLGVLEIFHPDTLEVDEDWLNYVSTLAGQLAIAVETNRLDEGLVNANQVLVQAYEETIEGWARALDLRDHETEGHSRRVTDASVKLARIMGLSDEAVVSIRRGALLHDIGKVGVPDSILLKPGKLTDEEWVVMKKHPQYSYELLSPISFLQSSLDIPYYHHEKWDGSGYPEGLSGQDIPLAARIFAVIDVWDALRSDRPYRKGWTMEAIEDYILSQSGKHFDPKVVEAFIKLDKFIS